jgi:phage baseplate assembly protein gpV
VSATDTEGKATGKLAVNAKVLEVKSMDVDKDKRTDKSLAKGSTMLLLSEKMFVGARDSKMKSTQLQVSSDKTGVFAENTLELQQAKAVVQLSGGNASVGGGSLDLYGKTTLQSDVTAKGAIKGGDIEMKNMKVSSSFKSPSTSEGIAMPGAPATGKLSAKLKEEELK